MINLNIEPLKGNKDNTYDLHSPFLKTKQNEYFCAGNTKNIGKDASVIVFHGHSRLEAKETVLHELTHSICHRISNLQSFDKNEFNALAKQANVWIKDFAVKIISALIHQKLRILMAASFKD